ncbi:hypothetical protein [Lactococcus garvieae]|uniref:hypothetical protein n=1 Tax=Lactococcus garvieae TaxID=1363 RepID=UPI0038545748
MLEINKQKRGSGKTNNVIELMKNDDFALCLVANSYIKRMFPKKVQSRVITVLDNKNIIYELRSRGCNKLIIDELLFPKFDIAELFL